MEKFIPKRCKDPDCGLEHEYLVPIDPGTIAIVKAIGVYIRNKKANIVHPRKEMETSDRVPVYELVKQGRMTSNMVGNLSRPRMHGLIAKIKGHSGNYCLTTRGGLFLNKKIGIRKYAIRNKVTGKTTGYFGPEVFINDFNTDKGGGFWEGLGYEILEGRVYAEVPKDNQTKLF